MIRRLAIALLVIALGGCNREARTLGPSVPQTAPAGDDDPRIPAYRDNLYQVSQGGRYFLWYGCSGCHGDGAPGALNLSDDRWQRGGGFADIYRSVGEGHGRLAFDRRIPVEQVWQLAAYIVDLPQHTPEKRRRLAVDQQAEPQGSDWPGPL